MSLINVALLIIIECLCCISLLDLFFIFKLDSLACNSTLKILLEVFLDFKICIHLAKVWPKKAMFHHPRFDLTL